MASGSDQAANEADALYIKAAAHPKDDQGIRSKVFHQDELVNLAGVESARALMPLIQELTNQCLLRTVRVGGKLGWSARPREAARHIVSLDREDRLLYEVIEEAHVEGIWLRDLKRKANMAQSAITKSLSKMEKANLIKSIKSAKNPAQRTYMLSHLTPSDEVMGSSFFDAGDLDESFRDELMNLIIFWVRSRTWVESRKKSKRAPKSPIVIDDDDEGHGSGRKRKRIVDIEDAVPRRKYRAINFDTKAEYTQLIHPAGTHDYPTAEQIHKFLTSSDAIKPAKAASLTVAEIQGCIDVLCWGEKLEKMPNRSGIAWGYRTVRGVTFKLPGQSFDGYEEYEGTGLTQSPCGRCPVLDLCHQDGPVNPQECIYFEQWLKA